MSAPVEEESTGGTSESTLPVVLLIEDNASDVFVIRQLLKRSGIHVDLRVASDGEEALFVLQAAAGDRSKAAPSLILLDWNLPRVSGSEILSYVRNSERWKTIPVVIVTSTSSASETAEMNRLGATEYFHKPTDLDAYFELGKVVKKVLSHLPH